MSEMVERVARILCEQSLCNPDALEPGDIYGIDGYKRNGDPAHFMWREFVERARAVIEAMHVPIEAMVDAGLNYDVTVDPDGIWKAMVGAALSTQP